MNRTWRDPPHSTAGGGIRGLCTLFPSLNLRSGCCGVNEKPWRTLPIVLQKTAERVVVGARDEDAARRREAAAAAEPDELQVKNVGRLLAHGVGRGHLRLMG